MTTRKIRVTTPVAEAARQLASRLPGKVVLPSDPEYETARLGWNISQVKHPEVIVFVETPQDVIEALRFAEQQDLKIAIQATGHHNNGDVMGTLLINTSHMQDVKVDPEKRTAYVEAGVKWGKVLAQTQAFGLTPLIGSSSAVGAIGYSLGGGLGWLSRKFGMCVDSITCLDVITLDGSACCASPAENQDLFWALCGGGGGFAVVTGMEIRLFPVSTVYAGNLFYPVEMAKEVFNRYIEWLPSIQDELTCSIVLMNFPPFPQVPPDFRGKSFVIVRGCYSGPVENGPEIMAYWRNWRVPAFDDFQTRPFTEADAISKDQVDPMPAFITGEWLKEINEEVIDALISHTVPNDRQPLLVLSEIRLAGGAIRRVNPNINAYSHREELYFWNSIALSPEIHLKEQVIRHFQSMRNALSSNLTGKVYLNFLEGQEIFHRTQAAFSEQTFQRLQAVKSRYDPGCRIISGYDIPPLKTE